MCGSNLKVEDAKHLLAYPNVCAIGSGPHIFICNYTLS